MSQPPPPGWQPGQPPPGSPPSQPFIPAHARPGGAAAYLPPGFVLGPPPVVWHSLPLLIGVAVLGFGSIVAAIVAMAGFPTGSATDGGVNIVFTIVVLIDLLAIGITGIALVAVERGRARQPGRREAPLDTRKSILAIVGVALSVIAVGAWLTSGGVSEFARMSGGFSAQYINIVLPLILAGVPWVLGLVFGAWGFRPGAHRVTNVLALIAVALGTLLVAVLLIGVFAVTAGYAV